MVEGCIGCTEFQLFGLSLDLFLEFTEVILNRAIPVDRDTQVLIVLYDWKTKDFVCLSVVTIPEEDYTRFSAVYYKVEVRGDSEEHLNESFK